MVIDNHDNPNNPNNPNKVLDLALPLRFKRLGVERISFIGGRDWVLEHGAANHHVQLEAPHGDTTYLRAIFSDFDLDICQVALRLQPDTHRPAVYIGACLRSMPRRTCARP